MSTPKRHHVVPKAYLSGFLEDGESQLAVFSKKQDAWRSQAPREILVHNKYYTQEWAPKGADKNLLEKTLGNTIEPNGIASLEKLFHAPTALDEDDIAAIAIYLELQRLRVPRQAKAAREKLKREVENKMSTTSESSATLQSARVVVNDSYRLEFMRQLLGTLHPYMTRMTWDLLEAKPGSAFITSDSPVTFENLACAPSVEAAIDQYGTIVLFPYTKRYCLRMSHPEYDRKERYGANIVDDESIHEDGMVHIRTNDPLSEDQVYEINCSLFVFAEDLVVCGSKNTLERNSL